MMIEQRKKVIQKVTYTGIFVNIVLAMAQIISGFLAHSQALLADGLHTLADLISDFIVLITAHHSAKEADDAHPYGHARIETLSSIFLGLALIAVALGMGYRGIQSFAQTETVQTETYALFFAFLAILSKEFLYRYTIHAARKIKSTLLESNALHHRSDVFSSVVVVIGVGAQVAGIDHMDALAAIVISVMISLMGIHLIKKAFEELIDTSLDQQLVEQVKSHIHNISGVVAVHSLRSRSMGGMGYIDTEIRVNPRLSVSEAHYISLHIEQTVKKKFTEISDITVHIDPVTETEHEYILQLPRRSELLFQLYSVWENLENSEKIKNIHLHYLTRQIEVDIILPLEFGCDKSNTLAEQLYERADNIPFVGKINIYYAP
ncbi:MAG: cation transporter [Gammaproteobacteria bacterium]|jgi:cation diffusion facilitator family transporter|nr:cation transporter [Gammaproteobacteria bacterium]MBT4448386.1 cation transporter [Gammaproteobacteria bacterium]MBT4863009.1 cation transporter [Gammaproteobacteria bacterium]MBT6457057.1 cation transporter [Gammaproteobacteria bacterium]MBT6553577.1 cation transporter [Gammaproteobacteria bacterium]